MSNDSGYQAFFSVVVRWTIYILILIPILSGIFFLFGYLNQNYSVWSAGMDGKAKLNEAEWSRQIAVREATAKRDSSIMLAQAEVERAKGVAKANQIIGTSLKNNEDYLRYLWIQNLQNDKNQVIYVPTEANLPILEAGRFSK